MKPKVPSRPLRGKAFFGEENEHTRKHSVRARETFAYDVGRSPLGMVLVARSAFGITAILCGKNENELTERLRRKFPKIRLEKGGKEAAASLAATLRYIDKPLTSFSIPLNMRGTPFQRKVWTEVAKLPRKVIASYSVIAKAVGAPRAVRAVGSSCTNNMFFLVVPCHRIFPKGVSLESGSSRISPRRQQLVEWELRNGRAVTATTRRSSR